MAIVMQGSPIIKLVKFRAPKSTTERRFFATLSGYRFNGDWLNDPMSLDDAESSLKYEIEKLSEDTWFKKSRRWNVKREAQSVIVWTISPNNKHEDEKMIGFELI